MSINNPPKALILLVSLVCISVLMIVNRIDTQTATGLIGTIIGYCIGNGIAAKNNDPVEPVFTKKPDEGVTE